MEMNEELNAMQEAAEAAAEEGWELSAEDLEQVPGGGKQRHYSYHCHTCGWSSGLITEHYTECPRCGHRMDHDHRDPHYPRIVE